MAVPKRRTSKMKIRMRKASHKREVVATSACPNCKAPRRPHRVCPSCGYYRGRQVVSVETA